MDRSAARRGLRRGPRPKSPVSAFSTNLKEISDAGGFPRHCFPLAPFAERARGRLRSRTSSPGPLSADHRGADGNAEKWRRCVGRNSSYRTWLIAPRYQDTNDSDMSHSHKIQES
eukprot:486847-Prorocentrum_minimum.AAC.1